VGFVVGCQFSDNRGEGRDGGEQAVQPAGVAIAVTAALSATVVCRIVRPT